MTVPPVFTRRALLGAGLVGAVGLAAAACTTSSPSTSGGGRAVPRDVALQLSWLHSAQFAGSYIALDRGWWSDAGLNVELLQGGPNAPVEPPVVSGAALLGISAADYAASAVAEGAPFKILGVAMQKNPFVIASLPDRPVNAPADMEGMKIGMAVANTPVLETLCTLNGVDIEAIEIVPTQYSAQPLLAGEVDCLLCWETDLPVAMATQGVDSVTMLMADYGYSVHSQTYIATADSLANRRDDLVALMAGEVRGWEEYRNDTAAAAQLTVDMFPDAGLDLETETLKAERQVPLMFSSVTDENGFGWWTDESVQQNIETLALLGQAVDADLWDRSILEQVHGG